MAPDVATLNPRYITYGTATTATTAFHEPTTTTTIIEQDQVDNNTNTNDTRMNFKNYCINRMNDKYHREDERLKSFVNWPHTWLDSHQLAQTGMFFTNELDKVKCYFCEVEIGRWEHEDQPVPEHLRWSPNCPLLRRRTTNNVPLNPEALERLLPPISYDVCGSNELDVREHAFSDGHIPLSLMIQSTGVNTMANGVASAATATSTAISQATATSSASGVLGSGDVLPEQSAARPAGGNYFPEYPEYAIESARLRSFADWPRNMKQKPQQLAEAGFFYTGVGDRVRCFSCGGGLKDWDDDDEPWEQHAQWLSHCRFLKLMRGQLYIDTVATVAAQPAAAAAAAAAAPAEDKQSSTNVAPAVVAAAGVGGDVAPVKAASAIVSDCSATRIFDKIVAIGQGQESGGSTAAQAACAIPEEKLCKICYAGEYNTAFLPCGHVVACAKCASSVTKCPLCRKPFTDVMRVYFS